MYEIDRICDRYRDVNGNIDYRALHEEVTDPADTILDAPLPTSSELLTNWFCRKKNLLCFY